MLRKTGSTAREQARLQYENKSPEEIAQSIGSFVDDPADNPFQREFLATLWILLREKKGWKEQ